MTVTTVVNVHDEIICEPPNPEAEQVFTELLLVCGPPPPIRYWAEGADMQQVWNLEAHMFLMNRGIGDDAPDRARITNEFHVWIAFKEMEA